MADECMSDYRQYEDRFDTLVGQLKTGQYGQFRGRLVKRLSADEFDAQLTTTKNLVENWKHP